MKNSDIVQIIVAFIYYILFIVVIVLTSGIAYNSQKYKGWLITWSVILLITFLLTCSLKNKLLSVEKQRLYVTIIRGVAIVSAIVGTLFWVGSYESVSSDRSITNWRSKETFAAAIIVWSLWIIAGFFYK